MKIVKKALLGLVIFAALAFALWSFILARSSSDAISFENYYAYDKSLPLNDSIRLISDSSHYSLYYATFYSTHNQKVTSLLSIPKEGTAPYPVVVLLHGVGDRKDADYVEAGNELLTKAGYAVLRLDVHNHGDRKVNDYEFSLTDGLKYWTRNTISQTVFDLQRAVDFLERRPEIDSKKIGYYGISLGGIIGTVFCGIDERIKAVVIAIAGGSLNLMYGTDALSEEVLDYVSIIDPINFVEKIAPRPLLMINAENDEIIPPTMSKLLFNKAEEPKNIIWYPTTHRSVPVQKVYQDGIDWYDEWLKK